MFCSKTINGMELGILNGWFDFLMERENTSLDLISMYIFMSFM